MRIAEIASVTGVKEPTVYNFVYRNKVGTQKRQGVREISVDVEEYISVLEKRRFTAEAARLRSYLQREDGN